MGCTTLALTAWYVDLLWAAKEAWISVLQYNAVSIAPTTTHIAGKVALMLRPVIDTVQIRVTMKPHVPPTAHLKARATGNAYVLLATLPFTCASRALSICIRIQALSTKIAASRYVCTSTTVGKSHVRRSHLQSYGLS